MQILFSLKIALILSYDKKNFYKQFPLKKNYILSKKINLNDIKDFIPEDFFTFWEQIMNTKAFKKNKFLFRFDGSPEKFNLDYNHLKESLSNTKINYYDMNEQEFINYTPNKYDAIFLSNILEWMPESNIIILYKFYNLLNDNGIIYDYFLKRKNSGSSHILKPETQIITASGLPGIEELTKEKVLVYRKTQDINKTTFIF